LTKASTKPKKAIPAKRKRATSRPVPYYRIAKLWGHRKTIPEIAKAIGRVGKGDDPYHSLRVSLTRMPRGYKTSKGEIVKLPYRISHKTVKLAVKAGRKAARIIGSEFRIAKNNHCPLTPASPCSAFYW
jgi:hypothetical protein